MKYKTRDEVKTPVGEGVVQGNFEVRQSGDTVEQCVLVRVPITDETRHLLGAASCLTPHANASALFVFAESELA